MHGLSPDLDLSCFVGSELHQICVGKFDVQFRFNSGAHIAVQSTLRVLGASGTVAEWTEAAGWTTVAFFGLLNEQVITAAVQSERVLALHFRNGMTLEVLDDSQQYESMQIYYPGGDVPVVI